MSSGDDSREPGQPYLFGAALEEAELESEAEQMKRERKEEGEE